MTKRTVFTTISPLPPGVSREVVLDFLHNHVDMIDLNPLVVERHDIEAPPDADPYEKDCSWYSLTDRIDYLRGAKVSGHVSYTCAFHDLPNGIQTHCRAPLGVDIRERWTLNGTLPGEPREPVEIGLGAPASGLYLREDVDLRCNLLVTSFVKKNLKRSHATLVNRLVERAESAAAGGRAVDGAAGASPVWSPPSYHLPRGSYHAPGLSPDGHRREPMSPVTDEDGSSVEGDRPGRTPSVRLVTPYQVSRPYTPPPSDDLPELPQTQTQTQTQAQVEFHLQCPPILRVPIQAPPPPPPLPPTRTAPPPPTRTAPLPPGETTPPSSPPPSPQASPSPLTPTRAEPPSPPWYPAPLRIHDHHHPAQEQDPSSAPTPSSSSSSPLSSSSSPRPSPATTVAARSSTEYDEHPDYPHLSPYSSAFAFTTASGGGGGGDGGDDDRYHHHCPPDDGPLPPRRTPAFMWKGYDFAAGGADGGGGPPGEGGAVVVVVEPGLEHPACLRPGGLGCRLDRPFIAELDC